MIILTKREREVLDLFIEGKCAKGAARILGLDTRTVDHHRSSVIRKYGVERMSDAAIIELKGQIQEAYERGFRDGQTQKTPRLPQGSSV